MTIFLKILVAASAFLFAVGGFAAWAEWIDPNIYIFASGVFGSIFSAIGLFGLFSRRISTKDVLEIEADLLKELSEKIHAVKNYENQAQAGRQEIERIASQKAEVELLVRQAALKVFMEERFRHISAEIDKRISEDYVLSSLLQQYELSSRQIAEIKSEIERSNNADLILKIVEISRENEDKIFTRPVFLNLLGNRVDVTPVLNPIGKILAFYSKALSRIVFR
jgi:hypothetical protein